MGYWIGESGYYEGDGRPGDQAVPKRPSRFHVWDGEAWHADLDGLKSDARAQISAAAEAARLQFVTPGSGKAMAYQEKAAEAVKFLADSHPESHNYPLLASEVGISAPEEEGLGGVATVVARRYQQFRQIEAAIGGAEAAAQRRVKEAPDLATILATLDSLEWPSAEG